MKKTWKIVCAALTPLCIGLQIVISYFSASLPAQFNAVEGAPLSLNGMIRLEEPPHDATVTSAAARTAGNSYTASLKLFGVFPVKDVDIKVIDAQMVVPCGTPFGIKMFTDGVLVVGTSEVDTAAGAYDPAKSAGIKLGDVIVKIDGETVNTKEQVAAHVKNSGGKPLTFRIRRDNLTFDVRFTPARSVTENCYKAGMWVRDSSAGIGTLTFYVPASGVYAGLGHPVCDVDTGEALPISGGEIVPACIYNVTKGVSGDPGELRGGFDEGTLGELSVNGETGVYGRLTHRPAEGEAVEIAMKQQVKSGYAQVLCTVDGTEPQLYDVRIDQIRYNDSTPSRNMVVTITDERLLAVTGGIVQGMSGSPLLQDGRLIGAITHVFVNEPAKGYAIFAENMLKTATSLSESAAQPAA